MSIFGQISLESDTADGVAKDELEFAIYGFLPDIKAITGHTAITRQLQAARRGVIKGSQIRVRKYTELDLNSHTPTGESKYVLTAKSPDKNGGPGLKEVNAEASEDLLNIFLDVAGEYMYKDRYTVPVNDIPSAKNWEIDVFLDKNDEPNHWVKIDLEFTNKNLIELPYIPDLGLQNVVITRCGKYSSEKDSEFVSMLYKKYLLTTV